MNNKQKEHKRCYVAVHCMKRAVMHINEAATENQAKWIRTTSSWQTMIIERQHIKGFPTRYS